MKEKLCPWLALGTGGLCCLLWYWIWADIYDPATQLVTSGGLVGLFSAFLTLCALILGLLARASGNGSGPENVPLPLQGLRLAAGALSLAAGLLLFGDTLAAPEPIPLLLSALLLAQGAAMAGLALRRKEASGRSDSLLLLPVFTCCYWLVAFYHAYGSCPSYVTYLWPMLAGLLVTWTWLAYAGRRFQPRKWDAAPLLSLLSVLVLCPALAAPLSLGYRLSLAVQILWLWSVSLEMGRTPLTRKENPNV